jgi:hypothetical protein
MYKPYKKSKINYETPQRLLENKGKYDEGG